MSFIRSLAWVTTALGLGAGSLVANPVPVASLQEGPVQVKGTVVVSEPVTAPLSGAPAAAARTVALITKNDGTHTVGPKEGKKLTAADFTLRDASGTVAVFVKAAKFEQVRWEPEAWDREVVRTGRKLPDEAQRAIRALMKEPEAMGLFATTSEVTVREAVLAPGAEVVLLGYYKKSPSPGIYPTDAHPLVIRPAGGAGSASGGGGAWLWAVALLGAAGACACMFLARKR